MTRTTTTFLLAILILLAAFLFLPSHAAQAAPLYDMPVTVTQPDGQVLQLFASGDEYYNWLHDKAGYTVLRDPATGWYVYASMVDGELVPTQLVAGRSNPAKAGLLPGLNISSEAMGALRVAQRGVLTQETSMVSPAPSTGTLTNLVLFIRFSGESDFTDPLSTYTGMFNDSTPGANSLRNYFLDVSYSALTVNSNFYPAPAGSTILSYQDSHPRTYFQPYDAATNPGGYLESQRTEREQTLLRDAIEYVKALGQFPAGGVIDGDNDGEVDSMTFVIKGTGNGWAELLWPHMWSLYYHNVTINGKTVGNYAFQLDDWMGNAVLAHEMFHVLGAPDLYHYNFDGFHPVGTWDVMESNTNPPQHMGCYMKYKYGDWIASIPQITQPGIYTLNPLTSAANNCYKIASPNSATEFFVLEYRRKASSTFESGIPGSGLLIYRINTAETGNADGPPDEVYIFRPGGTPTQDGTYPTAHFSSTVGRTQINSATDPYTFLSNGTYGGLSLCSIGAADATISFTYGMCGSLQVNPASHDFGSINLGSTSSSQVFSLTNNGAGSVTVGTLSVSSSYTLSANTCNSAVLAPAAACTFNVTFSPLSAGLLPGMVTIPSSDPSSPNLVGLSGTGSGVFASVNPAAWDFGDQAVSYPSGEKTFTLTSSGTSNLVLGTLAVSGDFSLANNTCNGQTLAPTATCTFGVVFTPTATGARSGSVSIPSNAFSSPTTVSLSGNGTTPGYCTSSGNPGYEYISRVQLGSGDQASTGDAYHDYTATNFTSLALGSSNSLQVTGSTTGSYLEYVKAWVDFNQDFDFNDPGEELNLGSYTFSGTHVYSASLAVPAGASLGTTRMRVILRYNAAPVACNTYTYGETEDYTVTIAASLDPGVQVSPASWDFGNQPVAITSAAKTFTLTNTGLGNLLTGTLTTGGDFALVSNNCNGQSLPPAATCTFGVTFTPSLEGTRNGSVSIPSNAAGSPHSVPLTGYGTHLPAAFNKSTPANGATGVPTSLILAWEASTYAQYYEHCLDTTNDGTCNATWQNLGTATSLALWGLGEGTTYYWQVRAANPDGVTYANNGTWWSFTTLPAPPGAFNKTSPANASTAQPTSLDLTWSASSGATGYEVCYDTTDDDACSAWTSNGTSTSKSLSGLAAGTTYFWQVRASNLGGTTYANGAVTAFWSFSTSMTPPGSFNKVSPFDNSIDQLASLTLHWDLSDGAAGYEYCYDTSNNGACNATWMSSGTNPSAFISGLSEGTKYYWQVRASNPGGTTYADSNTWWAFTTGIATPPEAFIKVSPNNNAFNVSTSPTLSWQISINAVSYEYCIDTSNDDACSTWISTGSSTTAPLTGLNLATSYYWQVRAVNPAGTTYADGALVNFHTFETQALASVSFLQSFHTDVFSDPAWTRSDSSVIVETAASRLHIGADLGLDDYAQLSMDIPYPLTFEARLRLVSGGNDYLLPWITFENGGGSTIGVTYLAGLGWVFDSQTFIDTMAPPAENTWVTIRVMLGVSSGDLWARFDGEPDFTYIASRDWSFAEPVTAIRITQPWDAVIDVDYIAVNFTPTFNDVDSSHWALQYVESLYNSGVTTGCGYGYYCPEESVTRDQMAVFLVRATHGSTFVPPPATGIFSDVPTVHWAAAYIEQLYADGITVGCEPFPLKYCPVVPVTRAQMAAFLLRAKHGAGYTPPAATGIFSDVPTSHWAAAWIEQLYAEDITTGCGTSPLQYCPEETVTRAQMAAFLVRTFGLP